MRARQNVHYTREITATFSLAHTHYTHLYDAGTRPPMRLPSTCSRRSRGIDPYAAGSPPCRSLYSTLISLSTRIDAR